MPTTIASSECPFVFACDAGYAMQLATALRSLADANRSAWPLEIYILSSGFSESTKEKILLSQPAGSCSVHWAPVDVAQFAGFSILPHISSIAYARLLIPRVLPESISRALYLDTDILVLGDLAPLCQLDLQGAVVGAVVDQRLDSQVKLGRTTIDGLPFPHVQDYFNDGVLLIDVARWRSERIPEGALEYLKRYPDTIYGDQDSLNVACDGSWRKLHSGWNCYQIDLDQPLSEMAAAQRPNIIHFHGWSKPWDPRSLNVNAPFYESFRSRTLFRRTPVEKLSDTPIVMWSRIKRLIKRSVIAKRMWNRFRLRRSAHGSKSGVSA
jgi:lipopolysaccharide biosynthesis glycosyltransferase